MLRDLESFLIGSRMDGYLLLTKVFLSGKFVWNSFESRFNFGSGDLKYFTLENPEILTCSCYKILLCILPDLERYVLASFPELSMFPLYY